MDARSEAALAKVEPDLVKIATLAMEKLSEIGITIVVYHGIRTVEEEAHNCATGHSETMHSRHLPDRNGLAAAIDVYVEREDGTIDWNGKDYQPVAAAFFAAAHELGKLVEWGGSWTSLKDWGHFQLPWALYP